MLSLPSSFIAKAAPRGALGRHAAAALFAVASGAAGAADFTVGVAGGPAHGKVDCVASFACDRSSTSFKLSAAYGFTPEFDLQAAYFGATKFRGGDTTPLGTPFGGRFEVDGFALSAGYRWQFAPGWSLTGRGGAASVHTKFDYQNAAYGSVGKTTLQPYGGLGLAYALTPQLRLGIDYDLTRFKVYTRRGSLQMLGVAAQYSF